MGEPIVSYRILLFDADEEWQAFETEEEAIDAARMMAPGVLGGIGDIGQRRT